MKILLIFPPLWDINLAPMLSMPLLSGMLKEEGHEVEIFDINSLFINFVLNKNFFDYFAQRVDYYKTELDNIYSTGLTPENIKKKKYFEEIIGSFKQCEKSLKNFYKDLDDIKAKIESISDNESELSAFYGNIRHIVEGIFGKSFNENSYNVKNLFYDWEQEVLISKIKEINPELIGFSIYHQRQLGWSNSFAKELKNHINAKIVFGGTEITTSRKTLSPELNKQIDVFIYGQGESAFKLLAKNEPLENIPNIIYLDKSGNIQTNEVEKPSSNIKFYRPNYNGINFNEYLIPQTVIPVESSRGCYWGKCEFCTFMDCTLYKQKNVDDFIEEIEEYINKYNIRHFFFTDAAIHPEYAREFSRKALEKNLKFYYVTFLRLEQEFDYDLLKLMYDAGLRIGMWGVESGSDKILQLYKKGTTVENNAKVLKNAFEIGIYNYCWIIIQLPKETIQDLNLTKNFCTENFKYIDYISIHNYTIYNNSPIASHPQDFGLSESLFDGTLNNQGYEAPVMIKMHSNNVRDYLMNLYNKKLNSVPKDISFLLLKLSKERP